MTRLLNLFRRRRDRLERDLDRELRYHMDRRVEDLIEGRTERARSPETGEPRVRRRAPGAGSRAGYVDMAMARCAHARRALCDAQPDQELGFRAWRRRRARPGHRCEHCHLLGGQHGVASAARLPRRRAPRLGRDVLDQHRTRQPGRVRSRLSRLAGAERRVREDGRVLRRQTNASHRWRPRRVCQPRGTSRPISSRSSARPRRRDAC